jgi:hypothetical protein
LGKSDTPPPHELLKGGGEASSVANNTNPHALKRGAVFCGYNTHNSAFYIKIIFLRRKRMVKRMTKNNCFLLAAAIVLVFAVSFTGCTTTAPIGYYSDIGNKNYDILGEVSYTGTQIVLLGFPSSGGVQFQDLYSEAKNKYSADWVVDVIVDEEVQNYLFLATIRTYRMRGLAIKFK